MKTIQMFSSNEVALIFIITAICFGFMGMIIGFTIGLWWVI